MNQSKIPVRYAKALFLLGKEMGMLDTLVKDIKLLSAFFENNPALIPWLSSPIIKMADKKELFRKQFGENISQPAYRFIDLVITKQRERFFPSIFRDFISFYKADAGIKTLIFTTAVKADEAIKEKLCHLYAQKNQSGYELIAREKPSIMGGFMLQVDDILYDASLATELKKLKKELTAQVKAFTG